MAQLTWQNIAAPDFRDTIMAQGQAADLFNKAATSLSGTFNAMGTDRENDRSMAAKAKLLEIQDPEAFKQLMANGGLASLGIDVAKTNDEFQNFANSYGDTLVQRADSERLRQRGFAADAIADEQGVKARSEADLQLGRTRMAEARTDENNARSDASLDAENKIRQFGDVASFDKMMANGGLASIGIDPMQLDNETTKFISDYRDSLLVEQDGDLARTRKLEEDARTEYTRTAQTNLLKIQTLEQYEKMMKNGGFASIGIDLGKTTPGFQDIADNYVNTLTAEQDAERTRQRGFVADERADKALKKEAEDKVASEAALRAANQAATDLSRTTMSKEEAKRIAVAKSRSEGWGAETLAIRLAAIDAAPESLWSADPSQVAKSALLPDFSVVDATLDTKERSANLATGADDYGRFYSQSAQTYKDYPNVGLGLIDRLGKLTNPNAPEEDSKAIFGKSAGYVQDQFNQLAKEFENIPKEVVAMAMENNLQSTGWIGSGDQLKFDLSQARAMLSSMNTPELLAARDQQISNYESNQAQLVQDRKDYDAALQTHARAVSDGNIPGQERALAELGVLAKRLSPSAANTAPEGFGLVDPTIPRAKPQMGTGATAGAVFDPQAAFDIAAGTAKVPAGSVDPVGPGAIDPSVARAQSVPNISGVVEGANNILGAPLDALAGGLGQAGLYTASGVMQDIGYLNSYLGFTGLGAGAFSAADSIEKYRTSSPAGVSEATSAPVVETAPPQPNVKAREDVILKDAQANPARALQMVVEQVGLDTRENSRTSVLVRAVTTGKDEQGKPLTPEQRKARKKELMAQLEMAGRNYPGGDTDPIFRLLQNTKTWLK